PFDIDHSNVWGFAPFYSCTGAHAQNGSSPCTFAHVAHQTIVHTLVDVASFMIMCYNMGVSNAHVTPVRDNERAQSDLDRNCKTTIQFR
ncbi:hypothetical protein ACJX0J_028467, partial [Zea mays]